jgi:Rod binding domain-containing protein
MDVLSTNSVAAESLNTALDNPRLKSAAHEFEASLMQEFLKPLQQDALFSSDDGVAGTGVATGADGDGGSEGALMSFGTQAMAKAISERGGFGIATKILDHFRTSSASEVRGSATKL